MSGRGSAAATSNRDAEFIDEFTHLGSKVFGFHRKYGNAFNVLGDSHIREAGDRDTSMPAEKSNAVTHFIWSCAAVDTKNINTHRFHGDERPLDRAVDPSRLLLVGLVGPNPGEPAKLGRGLAVLQGQVGQEPMGDPALLAREHREPDPGGGAVGRPRVTAGALEPGELDSGQIASVALGMAPNHPGEVLERIALAPVLQGQLRETQGSVVCEVAAGVAVGRCGWRLMQTSG